jgi:hypothetical protein
MSNLHKVQNIFISDGTALPANNGAISTVTAGKIGIFGRDMTALDPAGNDTITTQPSIYLFEANTDSDGIVQYKKSSRIDGHAVISYSGKSYTPAKREVWSIGHNRKTGTGTIEVAASTDYTFFVKFTHDKSLGSQRFVGFSGNFTSSATATQSTIADQIVSAINTGAFSTIIEAVKVGDGTGVRGVTGATDFGVEITAKDINQYTGTNYDYVRVMFSVHVDDSTGFGSTTTCAQIQANSYGVGTYEDVRNMEDKCFSYEGVINRTKWPIPALDYSSTSTLVNSAVIGINTTGTATEDTVTYASDISAIINPGEKVEIDGVNYEVKYIMGDGTGVGAANAVVLTSVLTTSPGGTDVTKIRVKYDIVVIEFNDTTNTPIGVKTVANKSVIIASPALDSGDAYNGKSAASGHIEAILDAWMATTPRAFTGITI